ANGIFELGGVPFFIANRRRPLVSISNLERPKRAGQHGDCLLALDGYGVLPLGRPAIDGSVLAKRLLPRLSDLQRPHVSDSRRGVLPDNRSVHGLARVGKIGCSIEISRVPCLITTPALALGSLESSGIDSSSS